MRNNFDNSNQEQINPNKMGGLNFLIISVISVLYILLITKLAEIISSQYSDSDQNVQIGVYTMIIYFVSIIGIIVGFIWFSSSGIKTETPNWIIRWSLSIGGIIMLIYTIINYWEYLGDYSKLFLIFLSITSIIYYLYKFY